jgi:hypothetical protein
MPRNNRAGWLSWFITFIVLFGVYLLYVSTLVKIELVAGIVCTIVATVASAIFCAVGIVHFSVTIRQLLEAWRLPGYAVQGSWEVFKALGRQLFTRRGADSLIRAVPFEVGDNEAPSAGRRALAVLYTTATPNFIVLGIAHKQALLLYHQVLPGPVLQMTINLGAQA